MLIFRVFVFPQPNNFSSRWRLIYINTSWTILMRSSTWLSQRCQVKLIEMRVIYVSSSEPTLAASKRPARRVWEHTPLKYYFSRALFHCNIICLKLFVHIGAYRLNRMVRWIRWHCLQAQGLEFVPWRSEANTPGLGHGTPWNTKVYLVICYTTITKHVFVLFMVIQTPLMDQIYILHKNSGLDPEDRR